jgi:hypothetical protein
VLTSEPAPRIREKLSASAAQLCLDLASRLIVPHERVFQSVTRSIERNDGFADARKTDPPNRVPLPGIRDGCPESAIED